MKRYRNNLIFSIIFLIFGLILLGFSSIDVYRSRNIIKARAGTYATVESINLRTNTTIVKYTIGEQTYLNELNVIDTSLNVGDEIIIYYDYNNPYDVIIRAQAIYMILYVVLGSIFILIFIIILIITINKMHRDNKLKKYGNKIDANIDKIIINRSVFRCPYKIECSYVVGKKTYRFVNNSVWFNIKDIVNEKNIKTVPVYIDGKNYKKYYIDLYDLEKLDK